MWLKTCFFCPCKAELFSILLTCYGIGTWAWSFCKGDWATNKFGVPHGLLYMHPKQ
jgi:hypothetical protein